MAALATGIVAMALVFARRGLEASPVAGGLNAPLLAAELALLARLLRALDPRATVDAVSRDTRD